MAVSVLPVVKTAECLCTTQCSCLSLCQAKHTRKALKKSTRTKHTVGSTCTQMWFVLRMPVVGAAGKPAAQRCTHITSVAPQSPQQECGLRCQHLHKPQATPPPTKSSMKHVLTGAKARSNRQCCQIKRHSRDPHTKSATNRTTPTAVASGREMHRCTIMSTGSSKDGAVDHQRRLS